MIGFATFFIAGSSKSFLTVAIISIDGKDLNYSQDISIFISEYYNCEVIILPSIYIPDELRRNMSDTLNPVAVLAYINDLYKDEKYDKYLVVTEKPISISTGFEPPQFRDRGFIRGFGISGGKSCIVSTFNIRNESKNDEKFFQSLLEKVSRHELGHTLGLPHCTHSSQCVMITGVVAEKFYAAQNIMCERCSQKAHVYLK